MLLTERVTIILNSRSVSYYERLGYFIPRRLDSNGALRFPVGATIEIQAKDLAPHSNHKVLRKCDDCGETSLIVWSAYTEICNFCKNKGSRNPMYGRLGPSHPAYGKRGQSSFRYNPSLTEEDRKGRLYRPEYLEWALAVKRNANYTCAVCSKRGGNLASHHLNAWKSFPAQRFDVSNGVCLCKSCHRDFHLEYGKGENTSAQFEDFKASHGKIKAA